MLKPTLSSLFTLFALPLACGSQAETDDTSHTTMTQAGAASSGTSGAAPSGTAGAAGASAATANLGGAGAAGANADVGGSFVAGGAPGLPPLDCGPNGVAIENAGPTKNRVNYVILGDGYDASSVETTYLEHIAVYMKKRFSAPIGEPYLRYRKFVNICALKVVSQANGIGKGATAFGCTGDDQSRLAHCDTNKAQTELAKLPEGFEVDWHSIVLNNAAWWNTGSPWMLWSGANKDAAGAALHEGGHGFHQLADEYDGTSGSCGEFGEVNSTADQAATNGKWQHWLDFNQSDGTGMQGLFQGSRYCPNSAAQFRPSDNSMMNSLFGDDKDTSFNAVSREKISMDIWRVVKPVDSVEPAEGAVTSPQTLRVNVIDPAVISVDWSVDGSVVAKAGGPVFDVAAAKLLAGAHTIAAKAYDNAPDTLVRARDGTCTDKQHCWNRDAWKNSQQTVMWTVTTP